MADLSVTVSEGWIVYDGQEQRTGGTVIEVPVEIAIELLRAGLVERRVPTKEKEQS